MVEREPSIGGHMAQFDKTFPTLDCSACILTPKMVSVGTHPNITLLTWSEVEKVEGYIGNFTVTVRKKARKINEDLCTGCGICQEKCPKKVIDDVFEAGLGYRKAVYTPFPQAVPNIPVMDVENCTYYEKGTCKACEKFCPTEAIDFDQQDEILTFQVGNIILATGYDLFDARRMTNYGYGRLPNVFTLAGVRAAFQCSRADRRQHRPAGWQDHAEGRGHRPLRGLPRPEFQQLLLGDLLHAEPQVRPSRPRAHRRHGLQLLHRHPHAHARTTTSSISGCWRKARSSFAARWPRSPMCRACHPRKAS